MILDFFTLYCIVMFCPVTNVDAFRHVVSVAQDMNAAVSVNTKLNTNIHLSALSPIQRVCLTAQRKTQRVIKLNKRYQNPPLRYFIVLVSGLDKTWKLAS